MTTPADPADRYAAYMRSREQDGPALTAFQAMYDFEFDEFQLKACRALNEGHSVLVAAPTGSGKTVVGEFAVQLAISRGRKCFYTTPIKALSNQKYGDLVRRYSPAKVGLLTGDNAVNGDAPVVVMTTEVLRNMLYAGSPALTGLSHVVLDEVHYLADRFRGAVWEEVIIHLPESVTLTALSATVSNAEEFGDWLTSVRGGTSVIVDEHRPVPLWQHMLVNNRLYDMFASPVRGQSARADRSEVNPELIRVSQRDATRYRTQGQYNQYSARGSDRRRGPGPSGRQHGPRQPSRPGSGGGGGGGRSPRFIPPRRAEVIARLDRAGLLPAITFIFSRAGCDAAVQQCLAANLRLTTPSEADEIAELVADRTSDIPDDDLPVLGYDDWLAGLVRGVAAHHAGLLPTFKEVVEELFAAGLIRAVFATETLALGINMPARTVVIERLDKWNGETHAALTAGEYTQLTGRAGRRGIDVEGHAVVLWQPGTDPLAVAGLAGTRTYPLNSSFQPSYNMAVNLVGQVGRERAAKLLESSFAQFQADRAVVGLARKASKLRESVAGLGATCDRGDFVEYARLRSELSQLEKGHAKDRSAARRAAVVESLGALGRGDIIVVPGGRRAGTAVVLEPGRDSLAPSPLILTEHRQLKRLSLAECPDPVVAVMRIPIPGRFSPKSPQHRKDLTATMRNKLAGLDLAEGAGGRPPAGHRASDALHRRGGRNGENGDRAGQAGEADHQIADLRRRLRDHPCHGCPDANVHARQTDKFIRAEREAEALDRRVASRAHVIARTFERVCALLGQLGYLDGDKVTPDGQMLASIYSELDLLTAECLRRGIWDGLNHAELAACVSALTFEARRPEDAGPPRLPGSRVATAVAAMTRLWGELDGIEHDHRLSFLREPDFGFAWTSHAWASGRTLEHLLNADLTPGDFVRAVKQLIDLLDQIRAAAGDSELAQTAATSIRALRRGVVAYTSVQ
ncbi:MAG TPA: DEAD/DEAH box helicase [Streptosporangiaceae bacterium]|nr:DEAD/DEAH box helicase [Streptosporangiaceae bacterium]